MYWFVHLGTITELNGWDAMNPGHFDQHLTPFYENDLKEGILTRAAVSYTHLRFTKPYNEWTKLRTVSGQVSQMYLIFFRL